MSSGITISFVQVYVFAELWLEHLERKKQEPGAPPGGQHSLLRAPGLLRGAMPGSQDQGLLAASILLISRKKCIMIRQNLHSNKLPFLYQWKQKSQAQWQILKT